MDAVEHADRHHAPPPPGRRRLDPSPALHALSLPRAGSEPAVTEPPVRRRRARAPVDLPRAPVDLRCDSSSSAPGHRRAKRSDGRAAAAPGDPRAEFTAHPARPRPLPGARPGVPAGQRHPQHRDRADVRGDRQLAAIAAIRTALNYFLRKEIREERQRRDERKARRRAAGAPAVRTALPRRVRCRGVAGAARRRLRPHRARPRSGAAGAARPPPRGRPAAPGDDAGLGGAGRPQRCWSPHDSAPPGARSGRREDHRGAGRVVAVLDQGDAPAVRARRRPPCPAAPVGGEPLAVRQRDRLVGVDVAARERRRDRGVRAAARTTSSASCSRVRACVEAERPDAGAAQRVRWPPTPSAAPRSRASART